MKRIIEMQELIFQQTFIDLLKGYNNLALRWGIDRKKASNIVEKHTKEFEKAESIGFENLDGRFGYFIDRRSPEQYVKDIFEGWIAESLALEWLKLEVRRLDSEAKVISIGSDKDRRLKFKSFEVTSVQDIMITWSNGVKKKIELQTNRKDRRKSYDHKKNKVNRANKDNSVFLWINLKEEEFFIVRPEDLERDAVLKPNMAYGGKETYNYYLPIERYVSMNSHLPVKYQQWLGFNKTILRKKSVNVS